MAGEAARQPLGGESWRERRGEDWIPIELLAFQCCKLREVAFSVKNDYRDR